MTTVATLWAYESGDTWNHSSVATKKKEKKKKEEWKTHDRTEQTRSTLENVVETSIMAEWGLIVH